MKRALIFFTFIICCFHYSCSQEVSEATSTLISQTGNEEVAKIITQNAELYPNNTQMSIVLIDGDKTTNIGVIKEQGELKIIDNRDAIFEIGSITKVFTSILLSKKVQDNHINLNDKMVSALPVSFENASEEVKAINMGMLANHTSGLPRISQNMLISFMANEQNPYKDYTTEMLDEFYSGEISLDNSPGSTYSYSNLGMGTLGYILAKKSNLTYEDLLQRDVLKPLEMINSSSILTKIDESKLVKGLGPEGKTTSNWDFTDATVGAGGIKSNAVDMEKFIRKNFDDDEVYNLPQKTSFTENSNFSMGLGWHISVDEAQNILWHNGGTGGYRSCLTINKERKKAVLVLSNVSAFGSKSDKVDVLCFDLMKKI